MDTLRAYIRVIMNKYLNFRIISNISILIVRYVKEVIQFDYHDSPHRVRRRRTHEIVITGVIYDISKYKLK